MAVLLTSPLHVVLQLDEFKPGVFFYVWIKDLQIPFVQISPLFVA